MVAVAGKTIDDETRCVHWHSELDIIAIKYKCCETYYPCYECHDECISHVPIKYNLKDPNESSLPTILCGKCKNEMTFEDYSRDVKCTNCNAQFNPYCKLHYDRYFDNI